MLYEWIKATEGMCLIKICFMYSSSMEQGTLTGLYNHVKMHGFSELCISEMSSVQDYTVFIMSWSLIIFMIFVSRKFKLSSGFVCKWSLHWQNF